MRRLQNTLHTVTAPQSAKPSRIKIDA